MDKARTRLGFVNFPFDAGVHSESPLFHSMACYDVSYTGESALVPVVADFVLLLKSLESRSKGSVAG